MNGYLSRTADYIDTFCREQFSVVFKSVPDGLVPPEQFDYHIHKYWELKFSKGRLCIQAPGTVHCATGNDVVLAVTHGYIRAGETVLNISEDDNIYNFLPELLDTLSRVPPELLNTLHDLPASDEFTVIREHLCAAVTENLRMLLKKLQRQNEYINSHRDLASLVLNYMSNHYFHSDLSVNDIARFAGVSPQYLNALLKHKTGHGIRQNLIRIRLEHAAELLENPVFMVKDAAALTRWKSVFYFGNSFRRHFGISPGCYRKHHTTLPDTTGSQT